jgi:hypothetical protein
MKKTLNINFYKLLDAIKCFEDSKSILRNLIKINLTLFLVLILQITQVFYAVYFL